MKKTQTKRTKTARKKTNPIFQEVIGFSIVGVGLIIIASVFTDKVGLIGRWIQMLLLGVLGIGGYMLPFIAVVVGVCCMRRDVKSIKKALEWLVPPMILLMILFHVMSYGESLHTPLMSMDYFGNGNMKNGGVIGAVLAYGLLALLGIYGTYIFLLIGSAIWLVLMTNFPLFSVLQDELHTLGKQIKKIKFPKRNKKDKPAKVKKIKHQSQQMEKKATDQERDQEWHPPIVIGGEEAFCEEAATIEMPLQQSALLEVQVASTTLEKDLSPLEMKGNTTFKNDYIFPSIDLLAKGEGKVATSSRASLSSAKKLEDTLASFGVEAKVTQINKGPTVTRYELQPKQGVKVSKIVNLADDIALNLAAAGIRIEAPIPGKAAVGIEVPNEKSEMVYLRDVIESDYFAAYPSKLAFALGKDIAGKPMVTDIAKMPHMLIAGATGSGKSVCINTLITSILYKADPSEVKLIMIDPKVVELNVYNGIPHLLIPVVTDPKKAAGALVWAVNEMTKRYNLFAENNVRDMKGYNEKQSDPEVKMPHIVIIIDELADLMMTAAKEVEEAICRLAQMARAAGLHLVIATQRPSVDVITGVIKANIPSRLAFAVSSGTDSRTILDSNGAEKLLGKGDMLFFPIGASKPVRIQGAFISDKEVESIVEGLKQVGEPVYHEEMIEKLDSPSLDLEGKDEDEYLQEAIELAKTKDTVSISMLQRYFRVGFNRASRIMDALEARGVVGPDEGSKPRKVIAKEC
jgi:S-DNA-T family DNA segregation ATPase FtsK/SpoIIIE